MRNTQSQTFGITYYLNTAFSVLYDNCVESNFAPKFKTKQQ